MDYLSQVDLTQIQMKEITFNEIPTMLAEISEKLDLLLEERPAETIQSDRLMPVSELQTYLEKRTGRFPARQTIYDATCKGRMPFERSGKYLYFRKSVIDQWLNSGRKMPERRG
jgi:hypothetical protein